MRGLLLIEAAAGLQGVFVVCSILSGMAKRPESAQTGVQAAVLLKEACNELNWVCNPFIEDFGIDFHVKAFESTAQRRALPWEFYVQVKGTMHMRRSDGVVLFPIDTAHLRDWQDARLPCSWSCTTFPTAPGSGCL